MTEILLPYLPILAYTLVLLFITLYAVLSSIEFGAAIYLALPRPLITREQVEQYFGPVWESTNVFLIFSLVGLVMFFPAVVPYLAELYALASVALLFFVVRVLGIFGIFYGDSKHPAFKALFAIGSLGAPLALSGAFYVSLTGTAPAVLPTTLLLAIWGAVVSAICILSATFILHVARSQVDTARFARTQLVGSGVFLLCAAHILAFSPALIQPGIVPLLAFTVILLSTSLAIVLRERTHPLAAFLAHALAVAALIYGTALSHLPYLIYPVLSIETAFTAPEMFLAMLSVVPFGLLIAIPTIGLLWHLYARSSILQQ